MRMLLTPRPLRVCKKKVSTEGINEMPVNPTHRPLVDMKASSMRTKQARAFRLEEKKGRPQEVG